MGGVGDPNVKYGSFAGFIFVFNLIIGVGALNLPLGFNISGLILGTIMLTILCFLSYVTITFMIEALSIANALSHPKASGFSMNDQVTIKEDDGAPEGRKRKKAFFVTGMQSLNTSMDDIALVSLYSIEKKVEVSELAGLFLGPIGEKLFFLVIVLYLYGDLAIYCVSVPRSLLQVTGTWALGNIPCCGPEEVSWFYMAGFALLLGPFCFFDFQQTKWLQYTTMMVRNTSLLIMIILAIIFIAKGEGTPVESANWMQWKAFPQIFGVAIYAFMCHHSLPGIITPMREKKKRVYYYGFGYDCDFVGVLVVGVDRGVRIRQSDWRKLQERTGTALCHPVSLHFELCILRCSSVGDIFGAFSRVHLVDLVSVDRDYSPK